MSDHGGRRGQGHGLERVGRDCRLLCTDKTVVRAKRNHKTYKFLVFVVLREVVRGLARVLARCRRDSCFTTGDGASLHALKELLAPRVARVVHSTVIGQVLHARAAAHASELMERHLSQFGYPLAKDPQYCSHIPRYVASHDPVELAPSLAPVAVPSAEPSPGAPPSEAPEAWAPVLDEHSSERHATARSSTLARFMRYRSWARYFLDADNKLAVARLT